MISLERLFEREGRCRYCRLELTAERGRALSVTREHMRPKSRAGGLGSNIVAACWRCNVLKADSPLSWFLAAYPDEASIERAYPLARAERDAARWLERHREGLARAAERREAPAMVRPGGLTDGERRRRAAAAAAYWAPILRRRRAVWILLAAFRRYLEGDKHAGAQATTAD